MSDAPKKGRGLLGRIADLVSDEVPGPVAPQGAAAPTSNLPRVSQPAFASPAPYTPQPQEPLDPKSVELLEQEVLASDEYEQVKRFIQIVETLRPTLRADSAIYPAAFAMAGLTGLSIPNMVGSIDELILAITDKRGQVEASLDARAARAAGKHQDALNAIDAKVASSQAIIAQEQEKIRLLNEERAAITGTIHDERQRAEHAKQQFIRACDIKSKELADLKSAVVRFRTSNQ